MFDESDSSVKWCIIRAASYSSFAGTAAKHNSPGASHRLLAQAWRSSFSGCESRQKPRPENGIQIPLQTIVIIVGIVVAIIVNHCNNNSHNKTSNSFMLHGPKV